MFLYASIIGPIAEELIWRGFLFRALHKYGKTTAVVVTSVLFGLMHGNIPQTISATMFGLLLGYITAEYSIKWSMALHIFHNSVLCSIQLFMSNADVFTALYLLVLLVFAIIGVVLVICKRKNIAAWIRSNTWEKPQMKWISTSVWLLLLVVFYLAETVLTIQKI